MIKTACLKCKISLTATAETEKSTDTNSTIGRGEKTKAENAHTGVEWEPSKKIWICVSIIVIMTPLAGIQPSTIILRGGRRQPISSRTRYHKCRMKTEAIIYTARWHWHQILGEGVSVSDLTGQCGGKWGEGGEEDTFAILPRAFAVLYYVRQRRVNGTGRPYACEDYWQYALIKQLGKANYCLKVNNNTVLSWREGVG